MTEAGWICPYDGMLFYDEMELRDHIAVEHGTSATAPILPAPTTEQEWDAAWAQIETNNANLNSTRTVLAEREALYRSISEGQYAEGQSGLVSQGTRLLAMAKPEELEAEWIKSQAAAVIVNTATIGTQAAILGAGLLPFLSTSYAMSQVYNLPFVRAAMNFAADVQMMPFNVVTRSLITRHLLSTATPYLPETYRIALAASKGLLTDSEYERFMAESGLSQFWAHTWKEENYQYPDIGHSFNLLWRGLITEETFKVWIQRQGFKKETADELVKLREVIPPLGDLIRFAVREAFGEHTAEEQYPAYESLAEKMGLSKEKANWYWYAHWDRISLSQMYANYYRGYWDKAQLERMLKIVDIHPDDREAIIRVAYQPPSIRELGYGWDVGKYKLEDIVRYRRMEGLSPEDAQKAAESLIDYRLEAEREALRREWMHLFALGKMSEEEFRKNLDTIFDAQLSRTELWIERGKLEALRTAAGGIAEARIPTSSEALWAFKNGLRTEEWVKGVLAALEWNEERISLAIERAKIEMAPPEPIPKPVEYRSLTISQIQDMYELRMIEADALPAAFVNLGYSPDDARILATILVATQAVKEAPLKLSRADIEKFYDLAIYTREDVEEAYIGLGYDETTARLLSVYTALAVRLPDLRALYSNGWINADELYYEIRALGLTEPRALELWATIVKVEKPSRTAAEKDLTKAEILKGAKSGILTPEETSSLLQDIGYDEAEAQYLLMINEVVAVGDPDSYWEMKRVTEQYKKSQGLPWKEVPQELITYEKRYKELQQEVAKLQKEGGTDEAIADAKLRLSGVESTYRRIVAAWNAGQG